MSLNNALPRGVTEQNKNMTDYERYLSGYKYGYEDQQLKDHHSMYIFQEGTGFGNHTDYFNLGYIHGFSGLPKAYEVVIKTRNDRTGEENAALARASMEKTLEQALVNHNMSGTGTPTPEEGNDTNKEEKTYEPYLGARKQYIKQLETQEAQENIEKVQETQQDLT